MTKSLNFTELALRLRQSVEALCTPLRDWLWLWLTFGCTWTVLIYVAVYIVLGYCKYCYYSAAVYCMFRGFPVFQLKQLSNQLIKLINRLPVDKFVAVDKWPSLFVVAATVVAWTWTWTWQEQGQIDRLQSALHGAARLIFGASRFSHVTPLLRDRLHWLRCRERIQFKLCLMVYKALNGIAPSYLSDLCITEDINERRRTLGSALTSTMTIIQPRRTPLTKSLEIAHLLLLLRRCGTISQTLFERRPIFTYLSGNSRHTCFKFIFRCCKRPRGVIFMAL